MDSNAHSMRTLLSQGDLLLLDGGLATELERRGKTLHPTLWSAECLSSEPDLIAEVHLDYLRAGANIITTATYQATVAGFEEAGFQSQLARDLIRSAMRIAEDAREAFREEQPQDSDRPIFVAASIGSYGAFTANGAEYTGDLGASRKQLHDHHMPRWEEIRSGDADIIAFETIPSIEELEVLMDLLGDAPDQEAWVALSCPDGEHLADGSHLSRVMEVILSRPSVLAVGVNCCSPVKVPGLLRKLGDLTSRPLLAYPNSGEGWDADRREWSAGTLYNPPDAVSWRDLGCGIIGGCCRTSPSDINNLRSIFDGNLPKNT